MRTRNSQVTLAVAAAAALLGFALVAFFLSGGRNEGGPAGGAANRDPTAATRQRAGGAPAAGDDSILSQIFGADAPASTAPPESWTVAVPRILVRLALAALLASALAYRPRRSLPALRRNPFVSQTQILLAVVASALMMIVGDSAARAFGIFAAASLVRFRTNISDPKEITVLLVSLAIGLATGVGRWELALVVALFVLPLLWALEQREVKQASRAMQLTVKTLELERTQEALKKIFRRHGFSAELRRLTPPGGKEPSGAVVYNVNLSLDVSTDNLSEEILANAPGLVDGIEWEMQKSTSYFYK